MDQHFQFQCVVEGWCKTVDTTRSYTELASRIKTAQSVDDLCQGLLMSECHTIEGLHSRSVIRLLTIRLLELLSRSFQSVLETATLNGHEWRRQAMPSQAKCSRIINSIEVPAPFQCLACTVAFCVPDLVLCAVLFIRKC